MSQAKSQVQVSITASLGKDFVQSFTAADKRMSALGKAAQDLNRKVGDIQGLRKQQEAVKQAGYSWQAAKGKADQFRQAITAQGTPTRKQAAELARLERATDKASAAFSRERAQLGEMSSALQKAGINTGKLAAEQQRLQAQIAAAQKVQANAERDSIQRQHRLEDVIRRRAMQEQKNADAMAKYQARVASVQRSWQSIQQHAAGAAAAGAVIGMAGRKALPYDEQLARLADTATGGGGDFKGAKGELSAAIQAALRAAGGGSREEVLAGLSTLIATGNMSTSDAVALLPAVAKGSFGGGASGQDIAGIMLKSRDMGVDPARALDIAHRGGQVGGVELRDQARYLPEQIGHGMAAGYSGDAGLAAIVAMNQVALRTSGTPDQAANNVTNLLQKLSSRELSKNVKKETGVDFDSYALKNRQNGVFKAESFAMLADKQMQSDPAYRALKKRAEGAKGAEQAAMIKDMASMMEGSGMGSLIQDRQALGAALALMFARRDQGPNGLQALTGQITNSKGALGQSVSRLSGETFAKTQMAGENINAANENAFNALAGPIGKVMDGFNTMTEAFPKVTAAAYGVATALTALAAYGLVGGAVGKLSGGAAAGAAGAAGGAAAGAAGRGLMARMGGRALLGRLGMVGLGTAAAWGVGEATGVLKQNDEAKGRAALDKGNYMEASRYMSASSFISGAFSRMTGGGQDAAAKAAAEAATAAQAASDSASKAVTAVQSRPNITQQNSYSITVHGGPEVGTAQAADEIMRTIKLYDKQKAAEARSSMFGNPAY